MKHFSKVNQLLSSFYCINGMTYVWAVRVAQILEPENSSLKLRSAGSLKTLFCVFNMKVFCFILRTLDLTK